MFEEVGKRGKSTQGRGKAMSGKGGRMQ